MDLINYYPIENEARLKKFLDFYIPLVLYAAELFSIDLFDKNFAADHLGLQALSAAEFDRADQLISGYSEIIHDEVIHQRRNRVYRFHAPITSNGLSIKGIETFEPKPGADLQRLKPGIEHLALRVEGFEDFYRDLQNRGVQVDKFVDMDGSKFFKTKLVNLVEIEFRNDYLGSFD